jgi:hypothetical protein
MTSSFSQKQLLIFFSLGYLLIAAYHLVHPKEVLTYYHNSEITYFKAQDFAEGKHHYGMFFDGPGLRTPRYEFHMAEGPTYIMGVWLKMGLPIEYYRIVPILSSWAAHLFFLMALFKRFSPKVSLEWIFFLFALIAYQPMVVAWSKAVDEGSFNMSIMVILLGISLSQHKKRWALYLPIGFLLGCQEFYRQPMILLTLWLVEFLIMASEEEAKGPAFFKAFCIASVAGAGALSGTLFHVVQLALVWNHWGDAWNEMMGAFLGRASIQNELNPDFYHEKLRDQVGFGAPTEWVRIKTMWKLIVSLFWYDQGRHHVWPILFIWGMLFAWIKTFSHQCKSWSTQWGKGSTITIIIMLFLMGNVWTLMMPNHSSIHYYYIVRDYLGVFWALIILIMIQRQLHSKKH